MDDRSDGNTLNRRQMLKMTLLAGGAIAGMCGAAPVRGFLQGGAPRTKNSGPPNFIIIYCDDLGYGDVGCYGATAISTPNIDRIAAEGMRFTDFYTCGLICGPSRAGLLTGRYPYRSGVTGNVYPENESFVSRAKRALSNYVFQEAGIIDLDESKVVAGIPERELLLSEMLKEAGYRTGMVGKWHLGDYSINPKFNPVKNGFDFYLGVPHSNDMNPCPLFRNEQMLEANLWGKNQSMLTGLYTSEAIQFIKQSRSAGKRFFLYFAHTFPHQPLWASKNFSGKSKAGKYGDAVEEIDWSVGQLLSCLKDLGVDENTLVIFTSDNGPWYEGSAAGFRGRKGQSLEGGFRVPMLARMPGRVKPQAVCRAAAMNIDFYPTFLGLAGAALPKDRIVDGRDIYGLLTGESSASPHEALFFYHFNTLEGVRVGKWKYLRRCNRYVWPLPLDAVEIPNSLAQYQLGNRWPLLYDLETDPGECYNLIDRHPEVVKKLEALMAEEDRARKKNPGGWL